MPDENEFVIGRELAAAMAADERRRATHGDRPSSLPVPGHDPWWGQSGLLRVEPLPYDAALGAFVRAFAATSAERRAALRETVGLADAYALLTFARRSSVFALRSGDASLVIDGLAACATIGYERIDPRDGLWALALLHHAAVRCGADAHRLFSDMQALGEPMFGELVDGLMGRPQAGRDLRDAWGHVETDGPFGLGLLRWGFARWAPTRDLVGMSLCLAEALRGDAYAIDDPELAVELPPIWLSAAGDPGLEPILEAARGTVVIYGRPVTPAASGRAEQQFTSWLVELQDDEAASVLAWLARSPRPGDALLGLASGPLFALVVARSVVVGVDALEDGAALRRFEPGVRAALEGGVQPRG